MGDSKTVTNGKVIYLDYAAATPTLSEVFEAMRPYLLEDGEYGNPGGVYKKGQNARRAVDNARRTVAEILSCSAREIIFTGSGTESDNLAIQGICRAYADEVRKGGGVPHVITSNAEHKAVLNTIQYLEKNYGFEATYLPVDEYGRVRAESVKKAIKKTTIFCSIMYANNEVGTVNDIAEIGKVCHESEGRNGKGVIFHTDACQAGGALPLNVEKLNVDLMTLNGSKIYGPKGIGLLYRRQGLNLVPLIFGGEGQEHRLRAGTENVAGIVGMAKALEIAEEWRSKDNLGEMINLRDYFIEEILKKIPDSYLNGPEGKARPGTGNMPNMERLPNNINASFAGIDGASLLIKLDMKEICAASGSACTSGSIEPSHVL
ncbi:cysteine desulfurase, partial [Candidatus Peregrinibacteria bacterium]|nr:cysteine desulfurase [Candidatus Peregrinibacteria bacterium]